MSFPSRAKVLELKEKRKENEKISRKNERKIAQDGKKYHDYDMCCYGNDGSIYL